MQIHQLVPALHDADATGDCARALRDYFRAHDYQSDIFAYTIDDAIAKEALNFHTSQPEMKESDVLILHYALPSGMTQFLKRVQCRKALIYHNITPSYFWLPYDPNMVHLASAGRKELETLAPFLDRSAGVSEFNRQELEHIGFRNTCVLPIYVNPERYRRASPYVLDQMQDGCFNFLSVGRVAPNKKLEDVLRLYFFYKRLYNPLSRLVIAGKSNVAPTYYAALKSLIGQLGLMGEDVLFTGHVDWLELVAYYKSSHVLISMSEHEGFCVPLVEAMICETPIVAYSCAAIPHILGDAGVQFTEKDFISIAGICHRLKDAGFRKMVVDSQRKQLQKYSRENVEEAIREFLAPLT